MIHRSLLLPVCLGLLLAVPVTRADVKIRPGDKPKESTKDFIKDQKKNGYPTPEPKDRTFSFTQGLSVDVELSVATSYLGAVKFTIRDQPQFGKLSEIKPHPSGDTNRAIVTYTHNGDPEQLTDKFTFQGKITETNTSAPGTITLFGKRSLPRLEVLDVPQFRRLQPGEQDAGRIVLLNSGTAPFKGEIKWPEPFIGPPTIELAINEKQTFMLMIKPMTPGAYRVNQEIQPGVATSRIQAYVECVQPFVATPSSITLNFDAAKGNRRGSVKVTNASDSPLKLKVDFPKRLRVVDALEIPAKTDQEVVIDLAPEDVASFHGEVWFVQEPHREKVVVHAEPEPPQLKLESPASGAIDFGRIERGKSAEGKFSLINVGGATAIVKLTNAPPFISAAAATSVIIEPGKSQSVTVAFAPEQPGQFKGTYVIGGNAGKLEVAMKGEMFDPKRPNAGTSATSVANPNLVPSRTGANMAKDPRAEAKAKAANKAANPPPTLPPSLSIVPAKREQYPAPPPPVTASSNATDGVPGAPKRVSFSQMSKGDVTMFSRLATFGIGAEALPAFQSKVLDPVPGIGLRDAGRDFVVISWNSPKLEPKAYLLQSSELVPNKATGLWLKTWKNVEGWKPLHDTPGINAGRIDGLEPNTQYEWRVIGVDQEGKFSPSSDLLRVTTLPAFTLPGWFWAFLVSSLGAVGLFVFRRVREQRMLA